MAGNVRKVGHVLVTMSSIQTYSFDSHSSLWKGSNC